MKTTCWTGSPIPPAAPASSSLFPLFFLLAPLLPPSLPPSPSPYFLLLLLPHQLLNMHTILLSLLILSGRCPAPSAYCFFTHKCSDLASSLSDVLFHSELLQPFRRALSPRRLPHSHHLYSFTV